MARVPHRKRLKHVKKGRRQPCASKKADDPSAELSRDSVASPGVSDADSVTKSPSHSVPDSDLSSTQNTPSLDGSSVTDSILQSYLGNSTALSDVEPPVEGICNTKPVNEPLPCPNLQVLQDLKKKTDAFLWCNRVSVTESDGLSVLLLSRDRPRAVQRNIFFHHSGWVSINVHCHDMDADPFTKDVVAPVLLSESTVNEFVDRVISIVSKIRLMEICAGIDSERFASVREHCPGGSVDKNPYRETRCVETFRSAKCKFLVTSRTWRCPECSKMLRPLRTRLASAAEEKRHCNTPNVCLTEEQKLQKLKDQHRELDCARKKIQSLHSKIESLVKKEGVPVDEKLYGDLMSIVDANQNKLTPAQEIFLHQQVKASQVNKKCGMRWHPTMSRLALSLHLTSPSTYQLLWDTGMVKLPSSRTLFDYSHVKTTKEGIDNDIVESITKKLENVDRHKRYHVLLADEMYISKNLVFQKSSGRIIGYTKLDEADQEVRALNEYLDDPNSFDGNPKEQIADKVLCYMVKGTSNGIKEVVASYAVATVTANQMYLWTWGVIGALERNGIRIVAFVCDGSTTNRSFIKLHTPVTRLKSGIVIDTVNKAAPDRVLYFMSDVAHLLKTIRNCFYKSRNDKCKGKRCMKRRGKRIVWDFIIKLYKEKKNRSLRKAYKLNPVNVFPDSFSCMKVAPAAQVLSRTVAYELNGTTMWESPKQ